VQEVRRPNLLEQADVPAGAAPCAQSAPQARCAARLAGEGTAEAAALAARLLGSDSCEACGGGGGDRGGAS